MTCAPGGVSMGYGVRDRNKAPNCPVCTRARVSLRHAGVSTGTYLVTLRVSDAYGLSSVQTTTATIAPPGQLKKP